MATDTLRTSYLHAALWRGRKSIIQDTIDFLRPRADQFDAIAFCGMSGALVAPSVADALDKHLIMVRKADDGSRHSSLPVEGILEGRYLILDDFISSGRTVKFIMAQIAKETKRMPAKPRPVAVFVYSASNFDPHTFSDYEVTLDAPIPVWRTAPNRRFDMVDELHMRSLQAEIDQHNIAAQEAKAMQEICGEPYLWAEGSDYTVAEVMAEAEEKTIPLDTEVKPADMSAGDWAKFCIEREMTGVRGRGTSAVLQAREDAYNRYIKGFMR